MVIDLDIPAADAPLPESLVRVEGLASAPVRVLWLRVDATPASPTAARSASPGRPSWSLIGEPDPVALLLNGRGGREADARALCAPRRRGAVRPRRPRLRARPSALRRRPADGRQLYALRESPHGPEPASCGDAASPRFPLAGDFERTTGPSIPRSVSARPRRSSLDAPGSPLDRDGLSQFGDALFLDHALRGTRDRGARRRGRLHPVAARDSERLTGIHALLDLEEVTIVAVPDAVQRRWAPAPAEYVPPAPPSNEPAPARRRPSSIARCTCSSRRRTSSSCRATRAAASGSRGPRSTSPASGTCCRRAPIRAAGSARGRSRPDRGSRSGCSAGRPGLHFYRVRAEAGPNVSPGRTASPSAARPGRCAQVDGRERLRAPRAARGPARAAAACAPRAATCSLSCRFPSTTASTRRSPTSRACAPRSTLAGRPPPPAGLDRVLPLDAGEQRALGFGALYHPWLVLSVPGRSRGFPRRRPTAPAAGVIGRPCRDARRVGRPRQRPFADAVALVHPSRARRSRRCRRRRSTSCARSRAASSACARTRCSRRRVRPINVRRLLSLVRRLGAARGRAVRLRAERPGVPARHRARLRRGDADCSTCSGRSRPHARAGLSR